MVTNCLGGGVGGKAGSKSQGYEKEVSRLTWERNTCVRRIHVH